MTTTIDLRARTADGHTLIVAAEPTAVPGLAIYQLPPEFLAPGWNSWRITHAPSGLAVGTAPSREHALNAVTRLGELGDWTGSPSEINGSSLTGPATIDPAAVWAALDQAGCNPLGWRTYTQQGAAA